MPSLRPRAMLMAARSSGRPTSVFRTEEVTNSSSSLPTSRLNPLMRLPAACAALSGPAVPPLLYARGLRKASNSRRLLSLPSALMRVTRSGSIECPRRYTVCANSAEIAPLIDVMPPRNGLIRGWTVRANSSKTRCWYSISVTNRAAWNSRSP